MHKYRIGNGLWAILVKGPPTIEAMIGGDSDVHRNRGFLVVGSSIPRQDRFRLPSLADTHHAAFVLDPEGPTFHFTDDACLIVHSVASQQLVAFVYSCIAGPDGGF